MDAILLWALPVEWVQFELLAPGVGSQIETEVRRRFEGTGVEEEQVEQLIASQLQALQMSAEDGVVLLATRPERVDGDEDTPPGLSLTLALANLPPHTGERTTPDQKAATTGPEGSNAATGASPSRSEPLPLVLKDPDMTAFMVEEHAEIPVAGADSILHRFQAQVFVRPKDQGGMAVVTVTTFDPDRTEDARKSAREFADTLTFVSVDEAEEEP